MIEFAPLTDALMAFAHTFNEEYAVEFANQFCADVDSDTIYYSILYSERGGESFYNNFVRRFPACRGFSLFLLSFMHELGHLETEWDMDDDTEMRSKVTEDEDYYNLHNEFIATQWAGEWIETHLAAAREYDTKFTQILNAIYLQILGESPLTVS